MFKSFLIKSFLSFKDLAYTYKLRFQYREEIKKKLKNKVRKLNKRQTTEIKNYYSKYGYHKIKTWWHEFYFASNGIYSESYVPEDIFHATISKKLNQMRQWPALLDKNLLDIIFKNYKQPEIVLKNINGFYFIEGKMVSKHIAIETIREESRQMIIKPSIDSGNGQNILSFHTRNDQVSKVNKSVNDLLDEYKKDFVVQIFVNQSEVTKSLNPSSLNTIRVLSYLNDKGVHILSAIMRIGRDGSFTDNFENGGIGCGVNNNGVLSERGYLIDGTSKTKTDNGTSFKNIKIPSYDLVLKQVEEMHLLIPYFKIVSWDIGIDNNNMPILIEYNTYHQGISVHQLANGPLFGNFAKEILTLGSKRF